jgi:regulator of cell morphogenesis and NO signaling
MSHTPTVFTPAGTPLIDRTVGEIVAASPTQARVFQSFGIDFCCQGGRTLREACELKGIAPSAVIDQLEAGTQANTSSDENPALLPPAELAAYIVDNHHRYLRDELPRILAMADRVARVHGGHTPSLVELFEVFSEMADELAGHIEKEERILFPAIVAVARGEAAGMLLDGPVAQMLHEHEDAGAALLRIRELTNQFTTPPEACNTYRALFAGLLELEEDLHRHIHLENSMLFPTALASANPVKS